MKLVMKSFRMKFNWSYKQTLLCISLHMLHAHEAGSTVYISRVRVKGRDSISTDKAARRQQKENREREKRSRRLRRIDTNSIDRPTDGTMTQDDTAHRTEACKKKQDSTHVLLTFFLAAVLHK